MLVTHGCEIDKPGVDVFLVARIRSLTELTGGLPGDIKNGNARSAMYIGPVASLQDSFVDFRYMHRVLRADLERANLENRRIASMTVDGRIALQVFLHRFHTRRRPGDPLPNDPNDI